MPKNRRDDSLAGISKTTDSRTLRRVVAGAMSSDRRMVERLHCGLRQL
jgi:hypothetical protein